MRIARDAAILAIACFFAVMWALALRQRITFTQERAITPDYNALLGPEEDLKKIAVGVYFGQWRVGGAETTITRTPDGGIDVRGNAEVALDGLGKYVLPETMRDGLNVTFQADISALRGLRSFLLICKELNLSLLGQAQGERLIVTGNFGSERLRFEQENLFLTDMFMPVSGLSKLAPEDIGQTWTLQVVNPILGSVEKVSARLDKCVEVETSGGRVRVFKIGFQSRRLKWHSWVDEDGEVLVQDTPFGLSLRREDLPAELLAALLALPPTEPDSTE